MIVALKTRITCPTCSHKIGYFAVVTVRVNKRSMRTTGGGVILGALEAWECPGCGTPVPRDKPLDREPYRLADEDAVKVADDWEQVSALHGYECAAALREAIIAGLAEERGA